MSNKYELQVTCKNPNCLKAFPLEVMQKGMDGPAFDTHKQAMTALLGMIQAERKEKQRNLHSIFHNADVADTEDTILAQGCPQCDRMYAYSAEEIFIQMPRGSGPNS